MNGHLVDDGGPIRLTREETLVRGEANRRKPRLWRKLCEWPLGRGFALAGTIGLAKCRATDPSKLARLPLPERHVGSLSHRRVITTACWALAIASSALADDGHSETPVKSIPTEIGVNADAGAMYLEENALGQHPADQFIEPIASQTAAVANADVAGEVRDAEPNATASDTGVMVPGSKAQEPDTVEVDEKESEAEAAGEVRDAEPGVTASDTGVMVPGSEPQEPDAVEVDGKESEAEAAGEVRDAEPGVTASDTGVMVPGSEAQEPDAVEVDEKESEAEAYSEGRTDAVHRPRIGESVSSSEASASDPDRNALRMPRTREPIKPIEEIDVDPEKVALGRALFHDPRLSKDNTIACVSCHDLANGGDDGLRVSVGVGGKAGTINSPTVFNAGLNFKQFWDGRADTLEEQIDGPVQSEFELASLWPEVLAKLHAHESYPARFSALYPGGITHKNAKNALAEFMKSLTTPNSRFDQWLRGDDDALTELEERGYTLFKLYGCVSCHQGANVGGNMFQVFGVLNNYFQKRGDVTDADLGRYNVTGDPLDRHAFKVPSLRMAALTAPYLHDGSAATLREALDAMFEFQLGRSAPDADKEAIVAFLKTLPGDNKELFQ